MYGSTRRTNSALPSAAGYAPRAGKDGSFTRCRRRLGMRGDRQLSGPVPGHWLADDPVHRRAIYGLLLHQEIDELLELGPVRADELDGGLLCLSYQPGNLSVDEGLGCLGEGPAGQPLPASTAEEYRAALGVPDRAKRRRQAKLADHLDRQIGGAGQVVRRAGRALPELDQLGCPAAEPHGQGVGEIVLAVKMPLI